MIDHYSLEKIAKELRSEAVKAADRERLATEATVTRSAARRSPAWSLTAVLRALGFMRPGPLRTATRRAPQGTSIRRASQSIRQ